MLGEKEESDSYSQAVLTFGKLLFQMITDTLPLVKAMIKAPLYRT